MIEHLLDGCSAECLCGHDFKYHREWPSDKMCDYCDCKEFRPPQIQVMEVRPKPGRYTFQCDQCLNAYPTSFQLENHKTERHS